MKPLDINIALCLGFATLNLGLFFITNNLLCMVIGFLNLYAWHKLSELRKSRNSENE